MKRHIQWHATAKRDMYRHAEYLAQRSLEVAECFIASVHAACELLATSPEIGELVSTLNSAHVGARAWSVRGFRNYLILYRANDAGVEIISLFHAAQDWTALSP